MPELTDSERLTALEQDRDTFKKELEEIKNEVKGVKKLGTSFASALKKFNKFENDLNDLRKSFVESEKQQAKIVETQEKLVENTYQLTQCQDAITKKQIEVAESQKRNEQSIKSAKRWVISLLIVIAGLFLYIATKNPTTAQDLAQIVAQSVVQAIK